MATMTRTRAWFSDLVRAKLCKIVARIEVVRDLLCQRLPRQGGTALPPSAGVVRQHLLIVMVEVAGIAPELIWTRRLAVVAAPLRLPHGTRRLRLPYSRN